ncbi:hypothetical protein BS78_10G031400 [Paspalum vaginatum]|nr:hypothetical protein BS78_10G031400 [Paspalum vaginatum]
MPRPALPVPVGIVSRPKPWPAFLVPRSKTHSCSIRRRLAAAYKYTPSFRSVQALHLTHLHSASCLHTLALRSIANVDCDPRLPRPEARHGQTMIQRGNARRSQGGRRRHRRVRCPHAGQRSDASVGQGQPKPHRPGAHHLHRRRHGLLHRRRQEDPLAGEAPLLRERPRAPQGHLLPGRRPTPPGFLQALIHRLCGAQQQGATSTRPLDHRSPAVVSSGLQIQ